MKISLRTATLGLVSDTTGFVLISTWLYLSHAWAGWIVAVTVLYVVSAIGWHVMSPARSVHLTIGTMAVGAALPMVGAATMWWVMRNVELPDPGEFPEWIEAAVFFTMLALALGGHAFLAVGRAWRIRHTQDVLVG